jgi:hypothetical protein
VWKLRLALRLDPSLQQARDALQRVARRDTRRLAVAGGVGGGAASLLVFGLLLVRRRLS